MTRMLASVSTLAEAETVLAGGADIIDLTDPAPGAQGAVSQDVIRDVIAVSGRRRPISATAASRQMRPDQIAAAVREIAATGVDYVRVGMFADGDAHAGVAALASLATQVKLIAVFIADVQPDLSLLPVLARNRFVGATLDTRPEVPGSLLDRFQLAYLGEFVEACHAAGLLAGLAGSLEAPDIPRLLVLAPDQLEFRAALRAPGAPKGALDATRVLEVRGLIPLEDTIADDRDADDRRLAARSCPPVAGEDPPVDLVFVEDLVLPVFIGAYAWERDAPQKVRFAVTASVIRTGRAAADMRDVFSYDLITDGIRMLVGSGHVALVETLAERIATMVLGHARVVKVVVRVEKLATGSGTVGVEIERRRRAARAMDRPVVPLMADGPRGASGGGTNA